MRWLESITDSMDTNLSKLQESVKDRGAWCAEVPGAAKSWIQLHIWTTHHSSSTWLIPVEFNHYQLTQVHSPIFPPSTLSSLAGSHFQCSHTLRSRGDNWTSSKTQYLHKLFGLFPMGNLFVLHLFFIHSTIYLNQYEPTDIYFTFWVIIVVQPPSCVRLCNPMDGSMPGLSVPHHLLKFAQVHVHCISDAIQSPHPLMPSSSVLNLWVITQYYFMYFQTQVVPTLVLGSFSYVPLIYFHHCVF